jgi:hypothetical protein
VTANNDNGVSYNLQEQPGMGNSKFYAPREGSITSRHMQQPLGSYSPKPKPKVNNKYGIISRNGISIAGRQPRHEAGTITTARATTSATATEP